MTDGLNGTLFAYLTPQEVGSIPAGSSASPVIFDRKIPGGRDALVCTIFTGGLTCGTGKADRFVVVGKTVWLVGSSGAPVDAVDVKLVPYCFSGI